jgi:hypothetical protein
MVSQVRKHIKARARSEVRRRSKMRSQSIPNLPARGAKFAQAPFRMRPDEAQTPRSSVGPTRSWRVLLSNVSDLQARHELVYCLGATWRARCVSPTRFLLRADKTPSALAYPMMCLTGELLAVALSHDLRLETVQLLMLYGVLYKLEEAL